MLHIHAENLPFAGSMLPFLGVGILLPPTIQDWARHRLFGHNGRDAIIGVGLMLLWEGVILHSVKSKRKAGKSRIMGRELSSWIWAPPVAFVTGVACGLFVVDWH